MRVLVRTAHEDTEERAKRHSYAQFEESHRQEREQKEGAQQHTVDYIRSLVSEAFCSLVRRVPFLSLTLQSHRMKLVKPAWVYHPGTSAYLTSLSPSTLED